VGLVPGATYETGVVHAAPGDLVILYTDGITEAENPAGDEYGKDRLREVCAAHRSAPLEEIATAVEADVERFADGVPFADDRTIVLVRRQPAERQLPS
jgi:sigma-B regulation protein RsbU (phosphoserine phosphatase)